MLKVLLTTLRDVETPLGEFRQAANQVAHLLAARASGLVHQTSIKVKTPLGETQGAALRHRVVLIPILRAGIALLPAFQICFPSAPIGFYGIRREEATATPLLYYENIPPLQPSDIILFLDPMIATGGTALLALGKLINKGFSPSHMALIGIIGSTEGLQKIRTEYPLLNTIVAVEDPELNRDKLIVPGLGDFGDRYFGTYT